MVGRKVRHELDNIIVQILEYQKSLRYTELWEEVNRRCELKKPASSTLDKTLLVPIGYPEKQLKKPSHSTFDRRLVDLEQIGMLQKEYKLRNTHYSLTEEFKDSLNKLKKKYPTTYVERTLQQFRRKIQYS